MCMNEMNFIRNLKKMDIALVVIALVVFGIIYSGGALGHY